jgi:hypothetical protein
MTLFLPPAERVRYALSSLFRISQARGCEICAMRPTSFDCSTTVEDPDGNIVDLFADL